MVRKDKRELDVQIVHNLYMFTVALECVVLDGIVLECIILSPVYTVQTNPGSIRVKTNPG